MAVRPRPAAVAWEVLVFAGNGFRCPLTELAERYGAQSGPVTDIYLPKWSAHNMPAIHTPLRCADRFTNLGRIGFQPSGAR